MNCSYRQTTGQEAQAHYFWSSISLQISREKGQDLEGEWAYVKAGEQASGGEAREGEIAGQ